MKTFRFVFLFLVGGVPAFGGEILEKDVHLRFTREIVLRVATPCSLSGLGSKLSVYPKGRFGDFITGVRWEFGVPRFLTGTKRNETGFYFDLNHRVFFENPVTLKIVRTTMSQTFDGTIVVHKGSVMPKVVSSGR